MPAGFLPSSSALRWQRLWIAALFLALLGPAPALAAGPASGLEGAAEFFGEGNATWKAGPATLASLKVQTTNSLAEFIRKNRFYGFALEDVRRSLATLGCEGEQVLASRVEGVGVVWCVQAKTSRPVVAFNFVETQMQLAIATRPPRPLLFDNASLRFRNVIGNWVSIPYDQLTFSLFAGARIFDSRLGKLQLADLGRQDLPEAIRKNLLGGFALVSEHGGARLLPTGGGAFNHGFVVVGERRVDFEVTSTGIAFGQEGLKSLAAGETLLILNPGGVWQPVVIRAPLEADGQLPVKPYFATLYDEKGSTVAGTVSALTWVASEDGKRLEVDWSPTAKGFVAGGAAPAARSEWTREESGTKSTLAGLWGTSASDLHAVGAGGLVLHYDGARWAEMKRRTKATLLSVWGFSRSDVLAVGEEGVILRYDGRDWKTQESGVKTTLRAVWGSDPSNVFAVGDQGVILRYDGRHWTRQASPTQSSLAAVWGSSGSDVWAAGAGGRLLKLHQGAWVNAAWRPPTEHGEIQINSIWGVSPSEFYLVGTAEQSAFVDKAGNPVFRIFSPVVLEGTLQGDRVRIRKVTWKGFTPGEAVYWDVWGGAGAGLLFASPLGVRHYPPQPGPGTLLGSPQAEPKLVWKGEEITAVWGTPEGDIVAVGQKGTILRQRSAARP